MAEAQTRGEPGAKPLGGSEELYLGDAIHFFLSAKRAGGRSERTIDDYRKKLELFQRWAAERLGGEDAVDAPYTDIGAEVSGRGGHDDAKARGRLTRRAAGRRLLRAPGRRARLDAVV